MLNRSDPSSPSMLPDEFPAYRLGNLLSLPNCGKWRGNAFAGMVVRRAAFDHPGVELKRLIDLHAVFPATLEDLRTYEEVYGEPHVLVENRSRLIAELSHDLRKRVGAARRESAKARLLSDLIGEWSDIENQCRMRWSGEFGVLMGKSEEQVRRYYLDREADLRTLAGKEDVYRDQVSALAEPILIAAAGMSLDIAPLHDFIKSMSFQWNGRNPKEWAALAWIPPVRYKMLHHEREAVSLPRQLLSMLWGGWWKLVAAVLTLIVTGLVVMYFRSKGLNLK